MKYEKALTVHIGHPLAQLQDHITSSLYWQAWLAVPQPLLFTGLVLFIAHQRDRVGHVAAWESRFV